MSFATRLFSDPTAALEASRAEQLAASFIEAARWPEGPKCPVEGCSSADVARVGATGRSASRRLYRCRACRRQFTWRHGTFLHGDSVPADVVCLAAGMLATAGPQEVELALRERKQLSPAAARRTTYGMATARLAAVSPTLPLRGDPDEGASDPASPPGEPEVESPSMLVEPELELAELEPVPVAALRSELPAPVAGELARSDPPQVGDVLPLSVPSSLTPGVGDGAAAAGRRRISPTVAALSFALLGILVAGAIGRVSPGRGLTRAWLSQRELVRMTTIREPGEGVLEWYNRHTRELAAMQVEFPPD